MMDGRIIARLEWQLESCPPGAGKGLTSTCFNYQDNDLAFILVSLKLFIK
jgi:hypothetical protein